VQFRHEESARISEMYPERLTKSVKSLIRKVFPATGCILTAFF